MTSASDPQEYHQRVEKMRSMLEPYRNDLKPEHFCGDLHTQYPLGAELSAQEQHFCLAGRVLFKRIMGKALFVKIQDFTGRIQCYARVQELGAELFEQLSQVDVGDFIWVVGFLFHTRTQELTVHVVQYQHILKGLRPLPDKFHGLVDQELRYRQRYVDLIVDEQTRSVFFYRSKIIHYLREFLVEERFLEVETPMMHPIPGGANARPFKTYHQTLQIPLYLRIAPELYLKRLLVGGFDRVFEINRCFRNEGISSRHNPEFTTVEFYKAYADFNDLMTMTEKLFAYLAEKVPALADITIAGEQFSLADPIPRKTLAETLMFFDNLSEEQVNSTAFLADKLAGKFSQEQAIGVLQLAYFEEFVEHRVIRPLFVMLHPVEVSPLARRNKEQPHLTDRFELFIGGKEIANAFSELNDPFDQAERFAEQVRQKDAGDNEAMHYDHDFINALEYGMPPAAGEGIGIDRLVMLLTGAESIKDVILFPTLKPKSE